MAEKPVQSDVLRSEGEKGDRKTVIKKHPQFLFLITGRWPYVATGK